MLHPYKFYGRDMSGILFFIFASYHPLITYEVHSSVYYKTPVQAQIV